MASVSTAFEWCDPANSRPAPRYQHGDGIPVRSSNTCGPSNHRGGTKESEESEVRPLELSRGPCGHAHAGKTQSFVISNSVAARGGRGRSGSNWGASGAYSALGCRERYGLVV